MSKPTLRLLGARLLVEPEPSADTTTGGIYLPESSRDENNTGGPKIYRVISTGPGKRDKRGNLVPMEINPGDRVICHSYTTGPIPLGDSEVRIITEDQVICVLPVPENVVSLTL